MTRDPIDILAHPCNGAIEAGLRRGMSASEARSLYRGAYRTGVMPTHESLSCTPAPLARILIDGSARKFTQQLAGGFESESVILPQTSVHGRNRCALCVSSQVGCAMGCTFCETGQMGRLRQLSAAEIVGQWFGARHLLGARITNIVFMGMGEPMDNLDAVLDAVRILADHNGAAIAPARITISTVGIIAGIERLIAFTHAEPGFARLKLAVSINAPNDAVRSELMPINRAAPLADLMKLMQRWTDGGRRRVLIEYVLIPGVNDALEHADELAAYLRDLPCTVNVIPYNPRRNSPWPAPPEVGVTNFIDRLTARGCFVKRRITMGRAVMAACGQLGNPAARRTRVRTAAQR